MERVNLRGRYAVRWKGRGVASGLANRNKFSTAELQRVRFGVGAARSCGLKSAERKKWGMMQTYRCMRAQKARPFCHEEVKFSTLQPGYPSVCLLAHARMAASPVKDMVADYVSQRESPKRMMRIVDETAIDFEVVTQPYGERGNALARRMRCKSKMTGIQFICNIQGPRCE